MDVPALEAFVSFGIVGLILFISLQFTYKGGLWEKHPLRLILNTLGVSYTHKKALRGIYA